MVNGERGGEMQPKADPRITLMIQARWFSFVPLVALSASGCGSSDDNCQPPNLDGSVAGGQGTATLTGNGTLPDGISNGLELQLLLKQGGATVGFERSRDLSQIRRQADMIGRSACALHYAACPVT